MLQAWWSPLCGMHTILLLLPPLPLPLPLVSHHGRCCSALVYGLPIVSSSAPQPSLCMCQPHKRQRAVVVYSIRRAGAEQTIVSCGQRIWRARAETQHRDYATLRTNAECCSEAVVCCVHERKSSCAGVGLRRTNLRCTR